MTHKLPYDMGNAGDLLKHGVLAEFVRWRCASLNPDTPFRFLDPFGGLPCEKIVKPQIVERVKKLDGFALRESQPEIEQRCYYGSGHVVRLAAENAGAKPIISVSDRCPERCRNLCASGFNELRAAGFDSDDGYSVLDAVNNSTIAAELVLIDPYRDFLPKAKKLAPCIAKASTKTAIVLFALNMGEDTREQKKVSDKWQKIKASHLSDAWVLHCPKMPWSKICGESGYNVEVLLLLPPLLQSSAGELHLRLKKYMEQLSRIFSDELRKEIKLDTPNFPS